MPSLTDSNGWDRGAGALRSGAVIEIVGRDAGFFEAATSNVPGDLLRGLRRCVERPSIVEIVRPGAADVGMRPVWEKGSGL